MIHVDSILTQRDMFRVTLKLSRFRLAIGCLVALLWVGILIWFFWFIDEVKILIQISPLFIGMPLLSVMGQVWRLRVACRKYIKAIPPAQRRLQYHFQEDADGYDIVRGNSFTHMPWQELTRVVEFKDYFVFYLNPFEPGLIPKSGFHEQSDISRLRQLLASRLGNKAKLLSGSVAS